MLQVTVHLNVMGPLYCLSCLSVMLLYCGQTVAWIKMPLGIEVGLDAGDTVLDGDNQLPHRKGHSSPLPTFKLMSVVVKWLDGS